MSKEVAKKQETNVAEFANFAAAPEMEILASMIKIPRLSLMQKTSKPVEDDKAKIGDLWENQGNSVVCTKDKPFRFVPLKIQPVITSYEEVDGKPKYKSHVNMVTNNQKYDWESGQRGEIHLYLLAESDLSNELALPYIFTVKGASMATFGKALFTQAALITAIKKHPFMYIFTMTNKKLEKDGNSYQVAEISKDLSQVDSKYFGLIDKWVTTLRSMSAVAVDFKDDTDVETKTGSKHDSNVQF